MIEYLSNFHPKRNSFILLVIIVLAKENLNICRSCCVCAMGSCEHPLIADKSCPTPHKPSTSTNQASYPGIFIHLCLFSIHNPVTSVSLATGAVLTTPRHGCSRQREGCGCSCFSCCFPGGCCGGGSGLWCCCGCLNNYSFCNRAGVDHHIDPEGVTVGLDYNITCFLFLRFGRGAFQRRFVQVDSSSVMNQLNGAFEFCLLHFYSLLGN